MLNKAKNISLLYVGMLLVLICLHIVTYWNFRMRISVKSYKTTFENKKKIKGFKCLLRMYHIYDIGNRDNNKSYRTCSIANRIITL